MGLTSTLVTQDGLALHLEHWPAAGSAARGTAILVHGLGEHLGRYPHVVAALAVAGWQVTAYDQRGHGRSQGTRGDTADGEALLRDLSAVMDRVAGSDAGPVVLVGHSMGGAVVARFVAEGLTERPAPWWRPVEALVMSSPALAIPIAPRQRGMLKALTVLAPGWPQPNGLKAEWLSHDPEVVAAYQRDPLVHDRITARMINFMLDAGRIAIERAPQWTTPTLLLYAGKDRCVDPAGSDAFAGAAPIHLVEAERLEALFHEIFNEPHRQVTLDRIGAWLRNVPMPINPVKTYRPPPPELQGAPKRPQIGR
jgi:alpha-beta hydrolase superfamily lysophospholipase